MYLAVRKISQIRIVWGKILAEVRVHLLSLASFPLLVVGVVVLSGSDIDSWLPPRLHPAFTYASINTRLVELGRHSVVHWGQKGLFLRMLWRFNCERVDLLISIVFLKKYVPIAFRDWLFSIWGECFFTHQVVLVLLILLGKWRGIELLMIR